MGLRSRCAIALAALAGLLVGLGGCGGTSSDGFTARAESACSHGHLALLAANPVPGEVGLRLQASAFAGMADALAAMPLPAGRRSVVESLIADYRAVAAAEREAAGTRDRGRLSVALGHEQKAFLGVRIDGVHAGLPICARQVANAS